MPLPLELSRRIPESNNIELRDSKRVAESNAVEQAYTNGMHGCFLDTDDSDGWQRRICRYTEDEFLFDTPHRNKSFDEVFNSLPAAEDENDGCHVYTECALKAFERDAVHRQDAPYTVTQDFGICVDSSNKQQITQLLGVRAMDCLAGSTVSEALRYIAAHYAYAERGYCGHGWTIAACATENIRNGWCPATLIEVGNNRLDWDEEDEHEYTVARDWCRSGIPDWLKGWTRQNFMFEDGAITRFSGGTDALKRLFANRGVFHHGSNYTSSSHKPNQLRRIGGHAQTACGGDWSDETIQWFADQGIDYTKDDFPCPQHQTWGPNWSGAVDARYWPAHRWGPKPEGAWLISSKQLLSGKFTGYAYLPLIRGVPRDGALWGTEPPKRK